MHLGKPLLVMPERCVEQRLNARAVERMGIGMRVDPRALSAAHLEAFLRRRDEFAASMARQRRDGLAEAITAIEQFLHELAPAAIGPQQVTPAGGHLVPAVARTALS
jgi:UDP:flavonoid glycosyltransferase YjiC (YdhE family)